MTKAQASARKVINNALWDAQQYGLEVHLQGGWPTVRQSFFYKHGRSLEKLANEIVPLISPLGYKLVAQEEIYGAKMSYFQLVFQPLPHMMATTKD